MREVSRRRMAHGQPGLIVMPGHAGAGAVAKLHRQPFLPTATCRASWLFFVKTPAASETAITLETGASGARGWGFGIRHVGVSLSRGSNPESRVASMYSQNALWLTTRSRVSLGGVRAFPPHRKSIPFWTGVLEKSMPRQPATTGSVADLGQPPAGSTGTQGPKDGVGESAAERAA